MKTSKKMKKIGKIGKKETTHHSKLKDFKLPEGFEDLENPSFDELGCENCGSLIIKETVNGADFTYCDKLCRPQSVLIEYCNHDSFEYVNKDGRVRKQCLKCHEQFGHFIKKSSVNFDSLPKANETDRYSETQKYYKDLKNKAEENHKAKIEKEGDEWWAMYDKYLNSEEWERKRVLILERDKHTCQSCLNSKATQVHHLTYERVGKESAIDLISICEPCHKFIHLKSNQDIYNGYNDFIEYAKSKYK